MISRRGGSSPRYVGEVLQTVADARAGGAAASTPFLVRAFFECAIDVDRQSALDIARSVFTAYTLPLMPRSVLDRTEVDWAEVAPIVAAIQRGDPGAGASIPETLIQRLAVAGTPDECAEKLRSFSSLGLDTPILYLHGPDPDRVLDLAGRALLPRLL